MLANDYSRSAWRDYQVAKADIGYARMCEAGQGRALISTWLGVCYSLELASGLVRQQPMVGHLTFPPPSGVAVPRLRMPACVRGPRTLCTAATERTHTGIWDLDANVGVRIDLDGPGYCVDSSADSRHFAVGFGGYSPRRGTAEAQVSLIDILAPEVARTSKKLPGQSVDEISFCDRDQFLVLATGVKTQDRGFVLRMRVPELEIVGIAETTSFGCRGVFPDPDAEVVVFGYGQALEIRQLDDLSVLRWVHPVEEMTRLAVDRPRRRIIMTNGAVVSYDGTLLGRLPMPEDCVDVLLLENGTLVGISRRGTVRMWEGK